MRERDNTDLGWAFEVYARGRLFTVAMRFFSLVACCAWCLNKHADVDLATDGGEKRGRSTDVHG